MTYHFKVGDDVQTNSGAGRIINRDDGDFLSSRHSTGYMATLRK